MTTKIRRHVCAAAAAVSLTLIPAPAQASADKCAGGGPHRSCVDVKGTNLHVQWIKSRVAPYAWSCINGHSQVLINGAHYADSNGGRDGLYCSPGYPGIKVTTGQWNVNKSYRKGTRICSKFWRYTGSGPVNGYVSLGTACVKVG